MAKGARDAKAWAEYMRAYYHSHKKYREAVKRAARAQYERIRKSPTLLAKERARGRDKYRRLNYRTDPKTHTMASRRWYAANREKKYAQTCVARAVKSGALQRPRSCERCGKRCKPEGHHANYGKPLAVTWWCRACHAFHHRKHAGKKMEYTTRKHSWVKPVARARKAHRVGAQRSGVDGQLGRLTP